ncbi:hypothetical protein GGR57DRAFT_200238 [Xylariaceae sp. FL1272]|nr:hypothetical protein GGR57DRAFT_200238 [Xylariaceae sp. FL1272]
MMSGPEERQGADQQPVTRPSRYRSTRNPNASTPPTSVATSAASPSHAMGGQQVTAAPANSISRSMSRYRRSANSLSADSKTANPDPALPPVPALPDSVKMARGRREEEELVSPSTSTVDSSMRRQFQDAEHNKRSPIDPANDREGHATMRHLPNRDRQPTVNRDVPRKTSDKHREAERMSPDQERLQAEAEVERRLAEQKKKDLQRLEEELENSQRGATQPQKSNHSVSAKFSVLKKRRGSKEGLSPTSPKAVGTTAGRKPGPDLVESEPARVENRGRGLTSQFDAPKAAINTGDRSVTVRCKHHTFSLPVTPETTVADILIQTTNQMTYDFQFTVKNSVVCEHYSVLSLERRIRHYENIRDVMNTWDRDAQNRLVVEFINADENHEDLCMESVAQTNDGSSSFQWNMYHSNRPGKWNKKWISLLGNGQIIAAKRPDAPATDKDTASLCRLSDYDIYTPTEAQMRRHLKPPKRFCFAIKSQQKTTIFLNTDNYVQYFCTEDPRAAQEFRKKVHAWRSWYLVDRRPEVQNAKREAQMVKPTENAPVAAEFASNKSTHMPLLQGHRAKVSMSTNKHYSIGKFEPFMDPERFERPLSQQTIMPLKNGPSTPRRLSKTESPTHQKGMSISNRPSEEGFTGGLLASQYEDRKQALAEAERKQSDDLTVNSGYQSSHEKADSPSWFPSALEHSASKQSSNSELTQPKTPIGTGERRPSAPHATTSRALAPHSSRRGSSARHHTDHEAHKAETESEHSKSHHSRREQPKPLVDLTPPAPTLQGAIQWQKRGHGVKAPNGTTHLVDLIAEGNGMEDSNNTSTTNGFDLQARSARRTPASSTHSMPSQGRSRSSSSARGRPLLEAIPPVPGLPLLPLQGERGTSGTRLDTSRHRNESGRGEREREPEKRPRDREREERERKQREREYREREAAYNAVPGRAGFLKVI